MTTVTNWDQYHKRIKIRQITAELVWKAYSDLLNGVHFEEPVKIIELGCGTGYNTLKLTSLFQTEKVTLVDFNPNMLDLAQKTLSSLNCGKEFLPQDLFSLDLSEKYNIVHSQGLLEHFTFEQKRKLIRLHKELLAADGVVIIMVPTPSLVYRFKRRITEMMHLWIYHDETAIPEAELNAELEYGGLQILKMKKYHFTELGAICQRRLA